MLEWFLQEGFELICKILGSVVAIFLGLNQMLTFTKRVRDEREERKKKGLMANVDWIRQALASMPPHLSLTLTAENLDLHAAGMWLVANGEAENLSTGPNLALMARRTVFAPSH